MKRREFVKSSLCLGCAGACGFGIPFAFADEMIFSQQEELAMQKFIYKSVDELPKKIRLDICNLCQLNCVACYVRQNEDYINKELGGFGYLKFEQFKKFIDENPFIEEIELSNNGEIFLSPDFDKIIEYAYKKKIIVTAINGTNLNTLSEKTAENLVKYQFRAIEVSIDGATPETYSLYRRGGDFNTVINNVKMINKYKKKYNSEFPVLIYKCIVFGHNEHEIEQVKKLAKDLDMYVKFDVNYASWYSPVKDKKRAAKLTGIKTFDSHAEKCFEHYKTGYEDWYFCVDLFIRPQINYNGDLWGCRILKSMGVNVFKDGLMKALNNKKVLYTKLMLTDFSYNSKEGIFCSKCDKYSLLRERNYPIRFS